MRRPRTSSADQYRLVMDCRQSGLSDACWCEKNNIQPSTFYNWVTRLREKGCEIPPPVSKEAFLPTEHQDVVLVDLIPDIPAVSSTPSDILSLTEPDHVSCLKLEVGGAKLEIPNDVNKELLLSVLHFLRSASC